MRPALWSCTGDEESLAIYVGSARFLGRSQLLRSRVERALPFIHSAEKKLFDFHRDMPSAFWAALALNLACHGFAVLEVLLVLWMMGVKIGLLGALVTEALTKLLNVIGVFNPGNVGTYEGGNMLIAKMFGLTGAVGLSLAVTRRLRATFWGVLGGLCLFLLSKSGAGAKSDESLSENLAKGPNPQEAGQPFTCVILANAFGGADEAGSLLPQVGTLPILLRSIICLQRAVANRIIVCVDPAARPDVQHELLRTRRLPYCVEWLEARSGTPITQLLQQVIGVSGDDHLMLLAGNSMYYPALFRQAREWAKGSGALALTCNNEPIGICVISADIAIDAAEHCPPEVCSLDQFHRWLVSTHSVEDKAVEESLYQPVLTPEDRIVAEKKLDRWLVKPTDGVFAQTNRRISVPISRQLIKLPITPNMVSVFTLGVGVASGFFFDAAVIGRAGRCGSSLVVRHPRWLVMEEVARLKLLESDFGCWLETICDYLYYVLIFGGMAIGLARSSGNPMYLTLGAVLLIGAVMSFLVAGFGRSRLAAGHPEQYLKIWQKKAENRRSNPILYIGRHRQFLARRAFLPYPILFFAILNIIQVPFFLSAIGANLFWLISLYSFCTFASPRTSSVAKPTVSVEMSV